MTLSTFGKGITFWSVWRQDWEQPGKTQVPSESPIAFLKRLKEVLQKFTNLALDSYKGHVILKDKFLSQCASDIRIKLQQLQQQDAAASLDEMIQTATNTFYNRE